MTLLTAKKVNPSFSYAVDDLFSLSIEHHLQSTQIIMKLLIPTVNTKDIPWTYLSLQKNLPSILTSTCFNEEKLPFAIEVRQTEIGHLFEHILLEFLCQEKLLKGNCNEAIFSGNTKWNWERDPWGMFHIYIKIHRSDNDIFPRALEKSVGLLKKIIQNEQEETFSYASFTNSMPHASFAQENTD
jgi:hypothetical protein